MSDVVLDASAVLAWIGGEPGAERVAAVLPIATLGIVNAAEVVGKLVDRGRTADEARDMVLLLPCTIVPLELETGLEAGRLRARTRERGLSLGDRACLALAAARGAIALTAERSWMELGIAVEMIR